MKKTAKIYIINIGGSIKNIKAFSKAQISKRLNISIYNINHDCQILSLNEWEEVSDNKLDIDLVKLPLLEEITKGCYFDSEIDNKCLKIFFENMLNNPDQFNKFYLAKYFKEAIELYGPDELYNLMEHKLENARFKGYGAWWHKDCSLQRLQELIEKHFKKSNEQNDIDICNYAMFIYFKMLK
jgi:hypothetical protein